VSIKFPNAAALQLAQDNLITVISSFARACFILLQFIKIGSLIKPPLQVTEEPDKKFSKLHLRPERKVLMKQIVISQPTHSESQASGI